MPQRRPAGDGHDLQSTACRLVAGELAELGGGGEGRRGRSLPRRLARHKWPAVSQPDHLADHAGHLAPAWPKDALRAGQAGTRKDTVMVLPGQQVACDFDAGNPGQWMTHCHNLYHAPESGMVAGLGYQG
ncbi:MAG: multicopper oxidase domain-containing protein [Streptosporangiaceae bacterium]